VPEPLTAQLTLGVGIPLIVNVTLTELPVRTFIVDCEAVICGTSCDDGVLMLTVTEAVAEPTALLAVQPNVDVPPLGTVFGAV
jgi:hypothetical protein